MIGPVKLLTEAASHTAGPYLHIGLAPQYAGITTFKTLFGSVLTDANTRGERIRIEARIFDGLNTPVLDGLIELWQANAGGRYRHPGDCQDKALDEGFVGYGRACFDAEAGIYAFDTIKPGAVRGRLGDHMAPHVNLWIVARGINIGLHTRMYFADEAPANAADPVLQSIEWEVRRQTLIAPRQARDDKVIYPFDIHLQGVAETVFFDL